MTTKRTLVGMISLGLLLVAAPLWAAARVLAGQWEHTMTTDGEAEPHKATVCMKAAEADGLNGDAKTGRAYFEKKMHGPCTIKTFELKGDTLSYLLSCGERTIENKVTFHGDSSEGVTVTHGPDGVLTMRTKSSRLGACP